MINRYVYRDITWIDIESPTREEIKEISTEFNINSFVSEDLITPSIKPKVEVYQDFICLTLHFPAIKHSHKYSANQEIDFIIGKKFLITTRYDSIDPLHEFSKIFEVNSILDKSEMGKHGGYLFFHMIKHVYKSLGHELDYIRDNLKDAEEKIFSGMEKEMVMAISNINRNLLDFKRATDPHKDILNSLELAGSHFFGSEFSVVLRLISGEYFKIESVVKNNLEFLKELRDTNVALVTTKQNEVMKILTSIAIIAVPTSVISSLFQINAVSRPIIGKEGDFLVIILLMSGSMFLMYAFFKYKKWL